MLLYTLEVSKLWFGILPLFVIWHYHIYDKQQVYTVLFQIPKYICCEYENNKPKSGNWNKYVKIGRVYV